MKNLIVPAVIGLLCMTGGFWYGMKLMPAPVKAKVAAVAPAAATPATPDAISIDTLKKTSESMMTLNDALRAREQAVALREQKVHDREDELDGERAALDASHDKFKALFKEFQDRLQLVEANQADQLQKQSELYTTMGTDQSIDLIRAMDDAEMARLFSVMEVKPLSKLVSAWKAKYAADAPRLLHVLDAMGQVMPKEKIALTEPPTTDTSSAPAPADTSSPAPAPEAPATDAGAPATAPAPDPGATTPPATTPEAAPDAAPGTPSATPPATPSDPAPFTPPPDSSPAPTKATTSAATTASTF